MTTVDYNLNWAYLPITETIYIEFETDTSINYGDIHLNILHMSEVTVSRSNVNGTSNLDRTHLHITETIPMKFEKERHIRSA